MAGSLIARLRSWLANQKHEWRWSTIHHYTRERDKAQEALDIRLGQMPEAFPDLNRYVDTIHSSEQKWFQLKKIVVATEADKEQLLLASRYIHDMRELDTDYMAVNYLAHLYLAPWMIVVDPTAVSPAEPDEKS
jgi:hypothetical protein